MARTLYSFFCSYQDIIRLRLYSLKLSKTIKIHDEHHDIANQKPTIFTSRCARFSQKINWNEATALIWRSAIGKRPSVIRVRSGFPAGVDLVLIWFSRRSTSPFEAAKRCRDLKPNRESKAQKKMATNCMTELSNKLLMTRKQKNFYHSFVLGVFLHGIYTCGCMTNMCVTCADHQLPCRQMMQGCG